jgi:hypothetical protein
MRPKTEIKKPVIDLPVAYLHNGGFVKPIKKKKKIYQR